MRWTRTEELIVRDDDGVGHPLATYSALEGMPVPSQRRFLASPDGRRLVFAEKGGDGLVIRAADGASRRIGLTGLLDFRFVNAATLAVSSHTRQVTVAVDRGEVTPVAQVPNVTWMEACPEGMVLRHRRGSTNCVSLVRHDGTTHRLAEAEQLTRVMAAPTSRRVAYCESHRLVILDLDGGPRRAWDLGKTHAWPRNGEISADGSTVAIAGDHALLVSRDGRAPRPLWVEPGINAVWLRGDELLAASHRKVLLARGRAKVTMPGVGRIATVRFARRGTGVIVARDREVLAWTPGQAPTRLAAVGAPRHALGAQRWDGGLAIWTGRRVKVPEEAHPIFD